MRPASVACLFVANIPEDTFVADECRRRVDDFKDRFRKARQEFSDSLQVEMIKGVHWLGEQTSCQFSRALLIGALCCRAK